MLVSPSGKVAFLSDAQYVNTLLPNLRGSKGVSSFPVALGANLISEIAELLKAYLPISVTDAGIVRTDKLLVLPKAFAAIVRTPPKSISDRPLPSKQFSPNDSVRSGNLMLFNAVQR